MPGPLPGPWFRLPDACPHDALSGDEGPIRDHPTGIIVRWRCDGCDAIIYNDRSLAELQARTYLGDEPVVMSAPVGNTNESASV